VRAIVRTSPVRVNRSVMSDTYSVWLGHQVVLQVDSGESRVPLRGQIINESNEAIRFRVDGRWDVDIFKEMIVRVEADQSPIPTLIALQSDNKVFCQPHHLTVLIQHWSYAWEFCSHHFSKVCCYKTNDWTGLAATILFLLALQIGALKPIRFCVRVVCAFAGIELSAVSLSCPTWPLGDSSTMKKKVVPSSPNSSRISFSGYDILQPKSLTLPET
jgi:hypothetical protein